MSVPTDLNVLDWGRGDQLAVALGGSVYLLDTKKGGINNLCELQPSSLYVSSLQWNRTGKYLAIGTSDAEVQVCVCTHACSVLLWNMVHMVDKSKVQSGSGLWNSPGYMVGSQHILSHLLLLGFTSNFSHIFTCMTCHHIFVLILTDILPFVKSILLLSFIHTVHVFILFFSFGMSAVPS